MNFSKSQIAILGGVLILVVVGILLFSCVIPGIQSCNRPAVKITGTISVWGVEENENALGTSIAVWSSVYPGVKIEYRNFRDKNEYESTLLDALAAGAGPDVFVVENGTIDKYKNKIAPFPGTQFSVTKLRSLFPQVVESDFVRVGAVYALPLSLDTLGLFYNRDHLDQVVGTPPGTWDEFIALAQKLTVRDMGGRITRAGAGIGGSGQSIPHAGDILETLFLQNGVSLVNDTGKFATFQTPKGDEVFRFYTQFADSGNTNAVWHESLKNAHSLFGEEKVSMVFGYGADRARFESQNPFLNFSVAPFPQLKDAQKPVLLARYFGYAVTKQSKNKSLAWQFIEQITTNAASVEGYSSATQTSPALRSVIQKTVSDEKLGPFVRQALLARSPQTGDPDAVKNVLSDAIFSVVNERHGTGDALRNAVSQVTQILRKTIPQ